MDKLIKYTILATIAGVILAFNMYHADYKLLVAQVGTIVVVTLYAIVFLSKAKSWTKELSCPRLSLGHTLMLVFFAIYVVSFLMSPHKLTSWQELYKVGTWIAFGLIVSVFSFQSSARNMIKDIVNVWLGCAGIVAIYGILQFFGFDFMKIELPGGRITSTFGNATLLAGFLAMTMPVAVACMDSRFRGNDIMKYRNDKVRKLIYGTIVIILFVCLILTKSRAGVLAAMIGMAIVAAPSYGARFGQRKALQLHFFIYIFLLSCIVLLILPQARHIIFDVILRKTARIYLWKDALQMVKVSPLFGTGIGTFALYFPDFVTKGVLDMHPIEWEFVNHAHSEYLEILVEMGIVGFVAFLAVIGTVVYKFVAAPSYGAAKAAQGAAATPGVLTAQTRLGLSAAFVTVLVHNVVSVDLRYTSTGLFFWTIAGILSWREK